MLYGHIAVGFAAKPLAPKVKLGYLLVAATAIDFLCGVFLPAGIEGVDTSAASCFPWETGSTGIEPWWPQAQELVRYSAKVKPGDLAGITGLPFSPEAFPLMEAVFREVLRAGGHPFPYLETRNTEGLANVFYEEGNDAQLEYLEPWAEQMVRALDCYIVIMAATNTRSLSKVDSSRIALHSRARADLFNLYLKRAAEGAMRWIISLMPTTAYAQDAEMSLSEFADFVFASTCADQDEPIAVWEQLSEIQAELVEKLAGKRTVAVQSPHTDLRFSIEDRTFINCDGDRNMPDGEIFTCPVEDTVNG